MKRPYTTSAISKLFHIISRFVRRVKFAAILKYHEWYLCQISRTIHAITFYYINTSEIPSYLSRENFISSHILWDHRRYGYIINRAFESRLIWYFTGVYILNRILHTRLWIWILSSCVQLNISLIRCAHYEISSWPLEDKIHIHARACNILYITYSLRIWILSSRVQLDISLVRYRVDHSKIKFMSMRGHVISSNISISSTGRSEVQPLALDKPIESTK